MLSESRKLRLSVLLAHQYLTQLTQHGSTLIRDAVMGNCGSVVCFRISPLDAEHLVKLFRPYHDFDLAELVSQDNFRASAKIMTDGAPARPQTMFTYPPLISEGDPEVLTRAIQALAGFASKAILAVIVNGTDSNMPTSASRPRSAC